MATYSPFKKEFDKLTVDDLAVLRDTSEGWYVEYKSQPPKSRDIAKSISALANSRGGWFFIGIDAPSTSVGCATGFPGVPTKDVPTNLQQVAAAVTDLINPYPYYRVKALDGPSSAIGLSADRSVIVVEVPRGSRPPYVHNAGVVYVRVGDKSQPVPENDRTRLHDLFRRSTGTDRRLRKFFGYRPSSWNTTPHVQVFTTPDLYNDHQWSHSITFSEFARMMKEPPISPDELRGLFSILLPEAQSSMGAFIARQRSPHTHMGMEWQFSWSGASAVTMPVNMAELDSVATMRNYLAGYKYADAFIERWRELGPPTVRIVDLSPMYVLFFSVFRKVRELLDACKFAGYDGSLSARIRVSHIAGVVPFIDTETFSDHVTQHGIPFASQSTVRIPAGDLHNVFDFKWKGDSPFLLDASWATEFLSLAMGLPWSLPLDAGDREIGDEMIKRATDWGHMFSRALEVNQRRAQNSPATHR